MLGYKLLALGSRLSSVSCTILTSLFLTPQLHRLAISVYFFCCGFIFASWAARIPSIKEKFLFNEAELGAVLFMLPLGSFIALPFAGWIVTKLGSRLISFLSAMIYGSLLLIIGYCESAFALSIVLFFFGFLGDLLNISMNTQALVLQQEMYLKPLMSTFHGMWSIGAMTGAIVGGMAMKAAFTTIEHFWIISILTAILAIVFFFSLIAKDSPAKQDQKLFVWPDKALLLLGAICFCCALCEGAMADWSSLYYKEALRETERVSTTGYTSFALMMAVGRLVGDRFTGKMGYKKVLMIDSLLIAAGLSIAILIPMPIIIIIGFGLVGLGVATIIPIVYSLSGKSKTMATSAALAAVSTIGFTGFLIGPPVIGFIAHEITLRWALLLVLVLGIVIFFLGRKVKL